eukprot:CAMPEP_0113458272 /NCGR_PEP_ID=MMETSP0014_2-20120614/9838_1 /TAXON_ID=2857 /ORGANISM="Nitzschia sp." /LENGTH=325 /DNA_ID=CAMNT_0000349793 /DNA_START=378 /DNA_END=1355 /DNA_ORIENTATION=- /assembly_acc=CAM_ASM_000159
MSFASPEADFTAAPSPVKGSGRRLLSSLSSASSTSSSSSPQWSQDMSFTNPESDFTAANVHYSKTTTRAWSQSLSFASPESDFVGEKARKSSNHQSSSSPAEWSQSLSFASPESDFVSAPETAIGMIHSREVLPTNDASVDVIKTLPSSMLDLEQSLLLLSSPDTATGQVSALELLDEATKNEVYDFYAAKEELPSTLQEALDDERPIVVTSASSPFEVVDVNPAWVSLCGFTREEAVGKSLQDLIQGPETDEQVAAGMVRQLRQQSYAQASLTNYTKDGRKFENRVTVGVVSAASSAAMAALEEMYFVGVLDDLSSKKKSAAMA